MRPDQGFTLVEVLVSVAVSAIALASLFVAYDIVEKQYTKIRGTAVAAETGRNVLKIMERDIRMAGFAWGAESGTLAFGTIDNSVSITDSGAVCCDEVTVIYDHHDEVDSSTRRFKIRYWIANHDGTSGSRNRLFKKTDIIAPPSQVKGGSEDAMADYIEDLQFVASGGATDENKLIEIYLALRTKKLFSREKLYQREAHYPGNSTTKTTDGYRRSEFSTSVAVRNLTL